MSDANEKDFHDRSLEVNPFKLDLLRQLRNKPQGVKIYDLLGGVDQSLLNAMVATDDYQLSSFRKNFLVMHALYQLQEDLIQDEMYLDIGQVEISLHPLSQHNGQNIAQGGDRKVRDYYFDWKNYFHTDRAAVDELLQSFWQRYHQLESRNLGKVSLALQCLGFEDNKNIDWRDIKQRYRELAHKLHPDRGGSPEKFIELREAYEVLALTYKSVNNEQ
ncbi:MAG: DnaJ domain-containing protein [Pseudomonadales bacterium]|nr:DnaJ domain-containing protein [Pseudomonadales bacterium]